MFWKRGMENSKGERFPQREPNTHNSKFSKMMSPERTKDFKTLDFLHYFILDLDFHPYPHFSPYTQYKVLPILPFWLETLLL